MSLRGNGRPPDINPIHFVGWLFVLITSSLVVGIFDGLRAEPLLKTSGDNGVVAQSVGSKPRFNIANPDGGVRVEGKQVLEKKGPLYNAGRVEAFNPKSRTFTMKGIGDGKSTTFVVDGKMAKNLRKWSPKLIWVWYKVVKGKNSVISLMPVNKAFATEIAGSTPSPAPQPEDTPVLKQLSWNLWAEDKDEPFRAQSPLRTGLEYRMAINLLPAELEAPGVSSGKFTQKLQGIIDDALKSGKPQITLKGFLLVDGKYFQVLGKRWKEFKIDLDRMRRTKSKCPDTTDMLDDLMKKKEEYECLFSRVTFDLKPKISGKGALAVVLFYNGRPIEEIKSGLCIEKCEAMPDVKSVSLKGIDSMRVMTEKSSYPDLALYLLELDEGRLTGILCDNSNSSSDDLNCFVWEPEDESRQGSLASELTRISNEIGKATGEDAIKKEGRSLISEIFPENNEAARVAYRILQGVVSKLIGQDRPSAPSIFVRVIASSGNLSPFLPIGLAVLKTDDGKEVFLGKHFRIEMPLPSQSYEDHKVCISKRVTVLPSDTIKDPSLIMAKVAMGDDLLHKWEGQEYTPFRSLTKFREEYLAKETETITNTALFVLSHYSSKLGMFWEQESEEKITPHDITHPFGVPSLWVLNGCETSDPDLAYKLNGFRIETIIGTVSTVEGDVAGKLYYCLDEQEKNGGLVSQLFHDAQTKCLWEKKDKFNREFGPKALKFILLGNGSVRLCPSKKGPNVAGEGR